MNYWVFKCDLEKYDLDKRLADPAKPTTWQVTKYRHEIKSGDVAFISQMGTDKGIRAAMQIQSDPALMSEIPSEIEYWTEPPGEEFRVKGELKHRCKLISFKTLKATPGLAGLSIFGGKGHFNQGTNFKITRTEGEVIMQLLAKNTLGTNYVIQ